jgi:hypothetical protein
MRLVALLQEPTVLFRAFDARGQMQIVHIGHSKLIRPTT